MKEIADKFVSFFNEIVVKLANDLGTSSDGMHVNVNYNCFEVEKIINDVKDKAGGFGLH